MRALWVDSDVRKRGAASSRAPKTDPLHPLDRRAASPLAMTVLMTSAQAVVRHCWLGTLM
jgi:hypothetical protein